MQSPSPHLLLPPRLRRRLPLRPLPLRPLLLLRPLQSPPRPLPSSSPSR